MFERRKLAEKIYLALHGNQHFNIRMDDTLDSLREYEKRKQKIIDVIEVEIPDVDAIRDVGREDERLRLEHSSKDPYFLGLRNSEMQDLINEKFSIHVRHFREGDMEAVLNYVVHEFNWQRVYDQIENIADKFIADLDAQRG